MKRADEPYAARKRCASDLRYDGFDLRGLRLQITPSRVKGKSKAWGLASAVLDLRRNLERQRIDASRMMNGLQTLETPCRNDVYD
jgi:hypothetical protein